MSDDPILTYAALVTDAKFALQRPLQLIAVVIDSAVGPVPVPREVDPTVDERPTLPEGILQ